MQDIKVLEFIKKVVNQMPQDWLKLTTHRLDIYNEAQAKTEFLEKFETLYNNSPESLKLEELPTAYDYIRLGHPLSCVVEWTIAKNYNTEAERVISFSSNTVPLFAVLRENLLKGIKTQINYSGELPTQFKEETLKEVYGYQFELNTVASASEVADFNGSNVFISYTENVCEFDLSDNIDFSININEKLGSVILISKAENQSYVSRVQHVRRRETIAMTPANCLVVLNSLVKEEVENKTTTLAQDKTVVLKTIKEVTGTQTDAVVASSGLSMQYAIMMGLVHNAVENHQGKKVKFIVPTNCYGGTNDQARRVAACDENVEVVDLHVDGENDMVKSLNTILDKLALEDAVPYIIAEIPTNPRVEVPNLIDLKNTLGKERQTAAGDIATAPVFVLDQTFCPNTLFLGEGEVLSTVNALSYVSGSKFPSGGKCTAGYCVANEKASSLMQKIALHLDLCDNEATELQYEILAAQLPSMNQRIEGAYKNTREFVNFIKEKLPTAKINFVSEELAEQGFTPSVFSLDLPTKGNTDEEREMYKRELNLKLINLMIGEIPNESKYCVSYGQLKGCYWTIPATSTQGTTKEGDKDYIARVAVSANLDLDLHKKVFADFVDSI